MAGCITWAKPISCSILHHQHLSNGPNPSYIGDEKWTPLSGCSLVIPRHPNPLLRGAFSMLWVTQYCPERKVDYCVEYFLRTGCSGTYLGKRLAHQLKAKGGYIVSSKPVRVTQENPILKKERTARLSDYMTSVFSLCTP